MTSLWLAPGSAAWARSREVTEVHFFLCQTDCFSLLFHCYRPCMPNPPQPHSLLLSCCGDLSPSGQRKGGKRGGRQPFSHSVLLWLPTELCHLFLDSCKSLLRPLEHLLWQAVLPSSLHPAETEVRPCRCPVKELCGAFSLSSECSPNPLTLLGTVSRSQNW